MSFFAKKISSDEMQDRSEVNNEENVGTSNDIFINLYMLVIILEMYKILLTIM